MIKKYKIYGFSVNIHFHKQTSIKRLGIVGNGNVGTGIGIVASMTTNYDVQFIGKSPEGQERSRAQIEKHLLKAVERGRFTHAELEQKLNRIKYSRDIGALSRMDFVIEASYEEFEIKQHILRSVEQVVSKECPISTTTSSYRVKDLAKAIPKTADRMLGLHFFQPVQMIRLVEMVKTKRTNQETMEKAERLCKEMKRQVVHVKDSVGFIHNRLFTVMMANAIELHNEGNSVDDIDNLAKEAVGLQFGPLALADFLGLDFCLQNANNICPVIKDGEYIVTENMLNLIKAGHLGVKTGKGFYDYKMMDRN